MVLNFDQSVPVHLILRQGDHYDKVFVVKKNGIDYDWANVTDIILQMKANKSAEDSVLELKFSTGDIEKSSGLMIWHIPSSKSDIEPGQYESLELLILFSNDKPKLWFDGTGEVKKRGIKLA
ncbi:MAG: hypothetical protein RDU14_17460 [Melioribacteraceae bacterium]|nr:hypothetical protein [Melioribacteraceae bacterium]